MLFLASPSTGRTALIRVAGSDGRNECPKIASRPQLILAERNAGETSANPAKLFMLAPMTRRALVAMPLGCAFAATGLNDVKALTFDVFGTVVDWRSSIIREGKALARAKGIQTDWAKFADAWRSGYAPAMSRVRKGELPWTRIDALHRMILDSLLAEFGIDGLSEAEKDHFNRAWHQLDPWPDAVNGLTRLKKKYIIATLSNGNVSLLTNMAKYAKLPWDCILSAELAKRYKPAPEVYLMAADLLGLRPQQVMMVAAHVGDLRAAAGTGMRTAFVHRPLEHGPAGSASGPVDNTGFDVAASDFIDLARKIGA
jgi:2-haloacid dehalogenase